MKTPEQHSAFEYIETARTPLSSPVKIDKILEARMQKFLCIRLTSIALETPANQCQDTIEYK